MDTLLLSSECREIICEFDESIIYTSEIKARIITYLLQLNEMEQIALLIAKEHLGTSFEISKSIGFIEWQKENQAP